VQYYGNTAFLIGNLAAPLPRAYTFQVSRIIGYGLLKYVQLLRSWQGNCYKARAEWNHYVNYADDDWMRFNTTEIKSLKVDNIVQNYQHNSICRIKHNNSPGQVYWIKSVFCAQIPSLALLFICTINKTLIVFFRFAPFCLIGGFLSDLTTICTRRKMGRKLVRARPVLSV